MMMKDKTIRRDWNLADKYYDSIHQLTDMILDARGKLDVRNYATLLEMLFDRTCFRVWEDRDDRAYKEMRGEFRLLWKRVWNPEQKGGKSAAVEKSRLLDDLKEWEHRYFWLLHENEVLSAKPDELPDAGDNP